MLKKLYDKSQLTFAILWIIAYCVLMSAGDSLSEAVGLAKAVTLPIGLLLSGILTLFLHRHGLFAAYGFCRAKASPRSMLWYLPVLLMLSANLWYGVTCNLGALETVLYILSMLAVGFLEEVIFRGLLFGAMRGDNPRAAVIVSSVTFGIGHIINLVNGSGAELLPNLLQVVYAVAAGFMFVMIYMKTDSLIVCIASHGIFNALSVFANEASASAGMRILTALLLTVIMAAYAWYLALSMKPDKPKKE
ncbi:MAG: CPBP family intramembrane metalloprotease [Ruminococcaceae bacterium]|nr:CPBP family intramembrane metalloprotease [Oscillospiraceae bacterium]